MEEVLAWLLPGAGQRDRARARALVTALRLLFHDARARGAEIGAGLERARVELEQLQRALLVRALEGLIHAQLASVLPRDSFLDLGAPPLVYEEAWSTLLSARGAGTLDVPLPQPGEPPLVLAERLLAAAARRGGLGEEAHALLGVRLVHVRDGPEAAEERWSEHFARATATPARQHARTRSVFLAGWMAARLDRFDPRGALELFRGNEVLVLADERLRRLSSQAALLSGELELARELASSVPARPVRLPVVLDELRARVESWIGLLPGRASEHGSLPRAVRVGSRRPLGALLFGVFSLSREGELCVLALDAAPGVREEVRRRLLERDGAWRLTGEPEQRLLSTGEPLLQHLLGRDPDPRGLRGALAGRATRALALVPVLDVEGECAGWLRIECEHHLLPSLARLAALADAWRGEVLAAHGGPGHPAPRPLADAGRSDPADPRLEFFEQLLGALDLKTARRRLYLVEPRVPDGFRVLAEHGTALGDWRASRGGERALRRSRRSAAGVSFGEPDPSMGLHAGSQSGLVLPLAIAGEARGFLVVESTRRRDFLEGDRRRLEEGVQERSDAWTAAQFRAWHQERFDAEISWDLGSAFLAPLAGALRAAARARSSIALVGARGSGKRTLARWLHFEGGDPARALSEQTEEAPVAGTWLRELETLAPEEQRALARTLDQGEASRLIVLSPVPLRSAEERGQLLPELARRLEGLALELPPLRDRRDEIPGLVAALARRQARAEARPLPLFPDETLALLWRQDWPGNVRELEALVLKLVLSHPGQELAPERVVELCRALRTPLRERLPSRRPRALDVELALRTTRHANGSWNRARAARYLGWDPDTLGSRMRALGLEQGG